MEQGRTILGLLQQRLELVQKLEELLKFQQKALIESDQENITNFAEKQVECLEKIQQLHEQWLEEVNGIKTELNLPRATTSQALEMVFTESEKQEWEETVQAYQEAVSRVEELKQNNTLLIHNALSLVRSTLQQLQGQPAGLAVYNPFRKAEQGHILVNKKM